LDHRRGVAPGQEPAQGIAVIGGIGQHMRCVG
jgi:hypothetical protein